MSMLATGHPPIPTTGDIDYTPLLYAALLLVALWRSPVPLRVWVLPLLLLAGGLIDSIANAQRISSVTVAAVLTLLAVVLPRCIVALTAGRTGPPEGPRSPLSDI